VTLLGQHAVAEALTLSPMAFAAAYQTWKLERQTAGRRMNRPVALFGLRG
jgi:hypothetical protein